MVEATLKRLQRDGAISSYELLEADSEGNVLDVRIRFHKYGVERGSSIFRSLMDFTRRMPWWSLP